MAWNYNTQVPINTMTMGGNPYYNSPQMQNPYALSNNYNYNGLNQYQSPNQTQMQSMQGNNYLNGETVTDVDSIKIRNSNLDGSPSYYPLLDGSAIYCKRLNPQTGASVTLCYKLDKDDDLNNKSQDLSQFSSMFGQLQTEIKELKDLVMESITSPTQANTFPRLDVKVGDSYDK